MRYGQAVACRGADCSGIALQRAGTVLPSSQEVDVMTGTALSRRSVLAGATATAAAGVIGSSPQAAAKAAMLNTQVPAFYRFKIGSIEATVVSDGPLPIGPATRTFRGPSEAELGQLFAEHFLPTDNVVLDQNCLVINTGDQLVLFDTGMASVKGPVRKPAGCSRASSRRISTPRTSMRSC